MGVWALIVVPGLELTPDYVQLPLVDHPQDKDVSIGVRTILSDDC